MKGFFVGILWCATVLATAIVTSGIQDREMRKKYEFRLKTNAEERS